MLLLSLFLLLFFFLLLLLLLFLLLLLLLLPVVGIAAVAVALVTVVIALVADTVLAADIVDLVAADGRIIMLMFCQRLQCRCDVYESSAVSCPAGLRVQVAAAS